MSSMATIAFRNMEAILLRGRRYFSYFMPLEHGGCSGRGWFGSGGRGRGGTEDANSKLQQPLLDLFVNQRPPVLRVGEGGGIKRGKFRPHASVALFFAAPMV
jgi:hypothetical protein